VIISPCRTQPVLTNAVGQSSVGPSVNVIAWSYSNTPDVGDVSLIGYVEFPKVMIVSVLLPLSILRTTEVSEIVSSPNAETS
jgi:hypothetical protein